MSSYPSISISGGDTDTPLSVRARLEVMRSFVKLEGARILDCGCGAGGYVRVLRGLGADAYGIEYEHRKVEKYKALGIEPDRVRVGNLEHLEDADGSYDVALLNEVLEHVPDDGAALREIRRVLKPTGTLIVFSPNRFYPFETHGVTLRSSGRFIRPSRAFLVPYVPLGIGARFFTYPARNYWPKELRTLLECAGFGIRHSGYLWQTFENISGSQPKWMTKLAPALRAISTTLQSIPLVRSLGVSQVIVAAAGS